MLAGLRASNYPAPWLILKKSLCHQVTMTYYWHLNQNKFLSIKALKELSCLFLSIVQNTPSQGFSAGPVVQNPPSNAGDSGSIPAQETDRICLGATKPVHRNYWAHASTREASALQLRPNTAKGKQINIFLKCPFPTPASSSSKEVVFLFKRNSLSCILFFWTPSPLTLLPSL